MTYGLFSYYYYLEEDDSSLNPFRSTLKKRGWIYYPEPPVPLFEPDQTSAFYELSSGNARVLVLFAPGTCNDLSWWKEQTSLLEEAGNMPVSDLLGQVHTLVTDGEQGQRIPEEAGRLFPRLPSQSLDIVHGKLLRYPVASGQVCFYAVLDQPHGSHVKLLGETLPLIELTLIRLQMISKLLRDRNQLVLKEKGELDRSLSQILHTQLVSASSRLTVVEELEEQITLLSNGYGKIAGNYSLILDGYQRLNQLINQLRRQWGDDSSLTMNPHLQDQALAPYRRRLDDLQATLAELQRSQKNHQAAIEVVRSRIDLLMSKENIATQSQIKNLMELNTSIQKQSLTFQFAAGLIEFIVLAYYSHSLWKALAPDAYYAIAGWIQFLFVVAFSANTVYLTHLLAEYMQGKKQVRKRLWFFSLPLILIFLCVIAVSFLFTGPAAH